MLTKFLNSKCFIWSNFLCETHTHIYVSGSGTPEILLNFSTAFTCLESFNPDFNSLRQFHIFLYSAVAVFTHFTRHTEPRGITPLIWRQPAQLCFDFREHGPLDECSREFTTKHSRRCQIWHDFPTIAQVNEVRNRLARNSASKTGLVEISLEPVSASCGKTP